MHFYRKIIVCILTFYATAFFSQEKVTTFGIQLKPIIPIKFVGDDKQEKEQSNIRFELVPKPGINFGMVIRKGFTKSLSLETGINLLSRNFDVGIQDPDSSFSSNSSFRLVNYEIPVLGLVYIKLGDNLFMNAAGGISFDIYPTDLFTFDGSFENAVNRFDWIRTSLLANIGWEYRTRKSGYFYFGASFHQTFADIARQFILYKGFDRFEEAIFDIQGSYLTLDFRYFFHEDKEKKPKKKQKKVKKDFRVKRPANLPKPK